MQRSFQLILAAAVVLAATSAARAEPDGNDDKAELARDLQALQGAWQFTANVGGRTILSRKTIAGETETVERYDAATGKLLARHSSGFRLSSAGGVRQVNFTLEDGRQGAYLYRLSGDSLYEVTGMRPDTPLQKNQAAPRLFHWQRVPPAEEGQ